MCNIRKLEQDRKTDFHNWDIACHTALDKKIELICFQDFGRKTNSSIFCVYKYFRHAINITSENP